MRKLIAQGFISLILICAVGSTQAQEINQKFGKISMEELTMSSYAADSSAEAVFLFDKGWTYFKLAYTTIRSDDASTQDKGFQYQFERHMRIKILKKDGFDYATVEIPVYNTSFDKEEVTKVKAFSYNLNESGKIEKTKLPNSDIIHDQVSDNWHNVKFTLPDVKVGTVIEVEYTIVSDYLFGLRDWEFQKSIPVMYSNYLVEIPEYFTYNQFQKGYYPVHREIDYNHESVEITYIKKPDGMSSEGYTSKSRIDYKVNSYSYTSENIPSFPTHEYKFLSARSNYLTSINFELASYKGPYSILHNYTTSWEAIADKMMDNSSFGHQLKNIGFLSNDVEQIVQEATTPEEKLESIFDYVQSQIQWNGIHTKYAESIRKTLKEKGGSVGDINLLLTAMLRTADIEAYPLLLSTRSNGFINYVFPSITSFNYVIVLAKINDQDVLLDASDKYCKIGQLPPKCINDKGRVIYSKTSSDWVYLNAVGSQSITSLTKITVDGNKLLADQSVRLEDYALYNELSDLKSDNDTTKYIDDIRKEFENVEINSYKISDYNQQSKYGKIEFELDATQSALNAGDILAFNPMLNNGIYKNPFKQDKREYPVEYTYPINERHSVQIIIPEGYEVESIPEQIALALPDKGGRFIYQISQNGNILMVNSILSINQTLFPSLQYEGIKNFYRLITEKHAEKIVLKKSEVANL